jgi:cholesterol transport system auxiliary component
MKQAIAVTLLLVLAACAGLPNPARQPALYDFGLEPAETATISLPVRLDEVESAPGLEGSALRYRLAYRDPARVYAYVESRWVTAPAQLLAQRIGQRLRTSPAAACHLRIKLERFDQVFDTPTSSVGRVQLDARLFMWGAKSPLAQIRLEKARQAPSADAQGGVLALTQATDEAISSLLEWARTQACGSPQR